MSRNKITLDSLVESLLDEATKEFQETSGLKWEFEHFVKIHDILSKIKEKEASRDGSELQKCMLEDNERRSEKFPAFVRWLEDNGVQTDNVEISNCKGSLGFGLKVKTPLKERDIAFTIPENIILTNKKVSESKLSLLIEKDPILRGMPNVSLAMYLLYEKFGNQNFESSFWRPYIETLPYLYDTLFYFTKEEMSILKYSPSIFREAVRMLRNVSRQYAYFQKKFRKTTDSGSRILKGCFTFNRYIWAVSAVTTRVNSFPSLGEQEMLALIPLLDLVNHEEYGNISTEYLEKQEALVCYSPRDFEKNDDFKIYYGVRSTSDFFIHNGFVTEHTRNDHYQLDLGIGINDLNYARKKAILGHLSLKPQQGFWLTPERLEYARDLFRFIRVFQADKEILEKIEANLDDLEWLNEPTNDTWKFLSTRFELLKKSQENIINNCLKSIFGGVIVNGDTGNNIDSNENLLSTRAKIILQLLKNEEKILSLLQFRSNTLIKVV